jgi:succinoglycan biosynthesis protein ExoI
MTHMLRPVAICVAAASIVSAAGVATAQTRAKGDLVTGPATVVDGHTLTMGGDRVRLWGIFAPESGAWCYRFDQRWKPASEAAVALRGCLKDQAATCRVQRIERSWFRRTYVAECWSGDGEDLGDCMVRGGWATDYTCYSGGHYQDLELEARNKRAGLWTCDVGPPTKRWGRQGHGAVCETPRYQPQGPHTK